MFPNIEAELARNHLNKISFAKKIGVSSKTVYNWLNGQTEIPVNYLIKMSKIFNRSTDYLLGINDKPA